MPLSADEQKQWLQSQGLNPDEYHVVETPVDPIEPPAIANTMTASQAFGKRLKRSLIPSLVALPGAAGGMELGATLGTPLGPLGMGAGGLLGGLVGGIGTHLLASKAQDAVIKQVETPQDYNAGLQEQVAAVKEHPVASALADFAPNALAFSPRSLMGVGRLGSSLLLGAKPAVADIAAGLQTAVNAGIGGGVEAGSQLYNDSSKPLNWNRILGSAALQGAFSTPTAIGRKLGFPAVNDINPRQAQLDALLAEEAAARQAEIEASAPRQVRGLLRPPAIITPEPAPTTISDPLGKGYMKLKDLIQATPSDSKPLVTVDPAIEKLRNELEQLKLAVQSHETKFKDQASQSEIIPVDRGAVRTDVAGGKASYDRPSVGENTTPEFIKQEGYLGTPQTQPEVISTNPELKSSAEKAVNKETLYQPEDKTNANLATNEDRANARELAIKRGVRLEEPSQILDPTAAALKRGFSRPNDRVAGISDIATRDTAAHELGGHQLMEDLRTSVFPSDQKAYAEGVKAAGSPEVLAESIGKRIVDINDAPLKSWLQDFWSNTKRLTRIASDQDMVNHLARRARDDRAYIESPELWSPKIRARLDPEGKLIGSSINSLPSDTTPDDQTLYSKAGKGEPPKEPSSSFFKALESPINRLESYGKGTSEYKAAQVARDFLQFKREYEGQFRNPGHNLLKNIQDPEKFMQYRYEKRFNDGSTTIKLSPNDQAISDKLQSDLVVPIHDEQRAIGRLVGGEREAKDNPNYTPTPISQDVIRVFQDMRKNPVLANKLREDYIVHEIKYDPMMKGLTPEAQRAKAEITLDSYLRNLNESHSKGTPEFAAINTAEGHGLPYSWTEKNPQRMWDRYSERVARDFAFHKSVLTDPEAQIIFNYKDRYGNQIKDTRGIKPVSDPALKTVYKMMTGNFEGKNPTFQATESLFRAGMLGTVTGIYNHVSGYAQMAPYISAKDLPHVVSAWKSYAKGLADSFDQGVNRRTTLDLEVKDVGPGYWADKMRTWANNLRKWQGANFIEQSTRGYHMAVGELTAQTTWARIRNSRADSADNRFMALFGDKNIDYKSTPINESEIQKIAAKFVERVQGTYDERGVPAALLTPSSPMFWMFNLAKWSVERSNIVKQDIINPIIKDGDFAPLIKYTLASTLTGAAIGEISQILHNRKSQTPNLTELMEKGSATDWAHKFAEVVNFSSFGGIVGDALMLLANRAKEYRTRQLGGLPSYEGTTKTAKGFVDALDAIHNGEPAMSTMFNWILDTVVNNIQIARIAAAHTTKSQDLATADKRRDLDVYKRLSGEPVSPPDEFAGNQYDKASYKEFKRSRSMEDAQSIMDSKIKPRLDSLSPETRKEEIKNLERNSYQTIPRDPREAQAYLDFVAKTQGKDAAASLLEDKRNQDLLNRRKSRLVPRR